MTTCEYKVLGLIGEGVQSRVYLAENATDCKKYALKLFLQESQQNADEFELASKSQHESIIQLKEKIDSADCLSFTDEIAEEEFRSAGFHGGYAMELAAHGDFLNLLVNMGPLPELLVRSYASQLIAALEFMNEQGIAHRSLKLENLLLDEEYCLKVAGFEGIQDINTETDRRTENEETFSTDVFSLGVILFELICGHSPFESASLEDEVYQLIVEDKWEEFWLIHEEICSYNYVNLYSDTKELLQSLLTVDAKKQLTIREVKNLAWMKKSSVSRLNVGSWIQEIAKKKKSISVLSPVSSF